MCWFQKAFRPAIIRKANQSGQRQREEAHWQQGLFLNRLAGLGPRPETAGQVIEIWEIKRLSLSQALALRTPLAQCTR